MIVGNKEVAVVFVLHFNKVPDGSEVVAKMQVTCAPDSA
jgi:hypothetical protein